MAESVGTIVKRGSIYIPPDNRRCYIKRLKSGGTYDASWEEITKYVTRWGNIEQGFPDDTFIGEYTDSDITMEFDNSTRSFNDVDDYKSLFYKYRTRYKTLFKIEVYAVDVDDNDVLLRAWYGISFSNPVTNDQSDMSFTISSTVKILDFYGAEGIDLTAGTTAALVTRLVEKTQNSVDIFAQYFTGFSINPDAASVTTISHPTIESGQTVLDKIKEYSFYDNFFYYIDNDGNFVWTTRDETATVQWEFNGAGQTDSTYGTNIQEVQAYYNDIDNTYTKVVITCGENSILDQEFFTGIGMDDGTDTFLTSANSATIYDQIKNHLFFQYIGTDSKLTQTYKSNRSILETYLTSFWDDYDQNILEKLDKTVKAEEIEVTAETSWTPGDGSVTDIYGEKIFKAEHLELTESEGSTIATTILNAYKNTKEILTSKVTGAFQLEAKDKVKVNYKGEVTVDNPFILGVSKLGGTDVLGGRTGSIRLVDWVGKLVNISINMDTFDITQKWREV